MVVNGVQHLVHPPLHLDDWPDADRRSRVVFIVRDLQREAIEASFAAFQEHPCDGDACGMKPKPAAPHAAPAVHAEGRPHLRVLGTEITLLEGVRRQAEHDLGISICFELLDFLGTQQKAARQPDAFDIYDQCFHNLDIVWFWRGVQPIDTGAYPLLERGERPHQARSSEP